MLYFLSLAACANVDLFASVSWTVSKRRNIGAPRILRTVSSGRNSRKKNLTTTPATLPVFGTRRSRRGWLTTCPRWPAAATNCRPSKTRPAPKWHRLLTPAPLWVTSKTKSLHKFVFSRILFLHRQILIYTIHIFFIIVDCCTVIFVLDRLNTRMISALIVTTFLRDRSDVICLRESLSSYRIVIILLMPFRFLITGNDERDAGVPQT